MFKAVTIKLMNCIHLHQKMNREVIWNPFNILTSKSNVGDTSVYAILILNTKIGWNPHVLLPLWKKANLRFTVDGGTNQWYKWIEEHKLTSDSIPGPHYVTGDMDSITVKYLEIIRDQHTSNIIVTDDQNETDFTKALRELSNIIQTTSKQIDSVIAVVDTAGRLDQIMANINTLFKAKYILENTNVYQLSNDSLSWLIYPGRHKIIIPDNLRQNQTWCALIPVGELCKHVTTTGLKWDLSDQTIKFGDLVSTSNTYSEIMPYVTIETDKPLLWSMGLEGLVFSGQCVHLEK